MHYLIDFDTRSVEAKSETVEPLDDYIFDNDLDLAVVIISTFDELTLKFSFRELYDLYNNLGGIDHVKNEDYILSEIWGMLKESPSKFPKFTKTLGKKLLKAAKDRDKPGKPVKTKTKKAVKQTDDRVKDLEDMTFIIGSKTPRQGMLYCIFTEAINDNLGEATFNELVNSFIIRHPPRSPDPEINVMTARGYIKQAYIEKFIEENL